MIARLHPFPGVRGPDVGVQLKHSKRREKQRRNKTTLTLLTCERPGCQT
jgi:hypothetical protein